MNRLLKTVKLYPQIAATNHISKLFCTSTYKLPYGQGGSCQLNLVKNIYDIKFQTIWQDECLVEINNKSQGLKIQQNGNSAVINDLDCEGGEIKNIQMIIKMPEDYTFNGKVNGSIVHIKSSDSHRLRSNSFNLGLLGQKRIFQWGSMQCPQPQVTVPNGAIDIKSLTFQNGTFKCHSFASQKVLFSGKFLVEAQNLVHIRSVVTYGSAVATIIAKYVQIQSISGAFDIQADKVDIARLWASKQGIKIKCKKVGKIGIETGTGYIESTQPIDQTKVTLGRLHKGSITKITQNKLIIE